MLEGTAARLAARHASEIEISELQRINDEMRDAGDDSTALAKANKLFHARLLATARNRFLVKSMNALTRTLLILGPTTLADSASRKPMANTRPSSMLLANMTLGQRTMPCGATSLPH